MCGIAGYIGEKHSNQLQQMLVSMEHRGRDGRDRYTHKTVHLGMNRLAINDLTEHIFPMRHKHYVLLYNGEIYNYKELKNDLENKGIHFKTKCDAEVILPLFDLYGIDAFAKLEGMFAVCIVDNKRQSIFLARDKIGEKPLYVMDKNGAIIFASELKALLQCVQFKPILNVPSLGEYFTQGFVGQSNTLIRGIYKVQPSQVLQYSIISGKQQTVHYWNLPSGGLVQPNSESKAIVKLEKLIESSVQKRLLSDVPVGCLLSGGIDSSVIAFFASRNMKKLKTFSISFPSAGQHDESIFSSQVAKWLDTDHHNIICTESEVKNIVKNIGSITDDPIVDAAMLPTYVVAREARKKVRVVLTGLGADELFAGYDRYKDQTLNEQIRNRLMQSSVFEAMRKFISPHVKNNSFFPPKLYYTPQCIWSPQELSKVLPPNIKLSTPPPVSYKGDLLQTKQRADLDGYLASQVLMMVDKSTMANNLETRSPYLDTNIIHYALSLPIEYKIYRSQTKYLLRKVAERHFPDWFVWRPKHGFSVPLRDWFNQGLRNEVYIMLDQLNSYNSLFNLPYCKQIVKEHQDRSCDHSNKIWSLMVIASWMTQHHICV